MAPLSSPPTSNEQPAAYNPIARSSKKQTTTRLRPSFSSQCSFHWGATDPLALDIGGAREAGREGNNTALPLGRKATQHTSCLAAEKRCGCQRTKILFFLLFLLFFLSFSLAPVPASHVVSAGLLYFFSRPSFPTPSLSLSLYLSVPRAGAKPKTQQAVGGDRGVRKAAAGAPGAKTGNTQRTALPANYKFAPEEIGSREEKDPISSGCCCGYFGAQSPAHVRAPNEIILFSPKPPKGRSSNGGPRPSFLTHQLSWISSCQRIKVLRELFRKKSRAGTLRRPRVSQTGCFCPY